MGKFYSIAPEPTIIIDFGWLCHCSLYPITLMPSWGKLGSSRERAPGNAYNVSPVFSNGIIFYR
jgi:hypothetical protein